MMKLYFSNMNKKQIVENLADDIGGLIHVGLRKWCDDPQSHIIWEAIHKMEDGAWEDLCKIVANEIYPETRKAFKKQFKESVR